MGSFGEDKASLLRGDCPEDVKLELGLESKSYLVKRRREATTGEGRMEYYVRLDSMPKKVWLPIHIRRFRWSMYQSAWATIAEYNRLGDLNHRNLFSQFWRLQVQNQGVSWGGFW